jgi:hypothetical protein
MNNGATRAVCSLPAEVDPSENRAETRCEVSDDALGNVIEFWPNDLASQRKICPRHMWRA